MKILIVATLCAQVFSMDLPEYCGVPGTYSSHLERIIIWGFGEVVGGRGRGLSFLLNIPFDEMHAICIGQMSYSIGKNNIVSNGCLLPTFLFPLFTNDSTHVHTSHPSIQP